MIPLWHKCSWLLFLVAFSTLLSTQYASADTIYSVNNNDTISYISTSDDSVTTPIALVSGSKPTAICLNPITPRAYTLNSGTNTISVIDTTLRSVVDTISSTRFTEIVSIACDPTGKSVLIGNNSASNASNILYLNTATLTLDSGETSVDSNPGSIVFNQNGSKAYILSLGGPSLTTINMATQLVAMGPVPLTEAEAPLVLAMHTQDNYLYVLNLLVSNVALYNPETLALYKTISTGMFPTNIVVSSTTNLLYVVNSDNTVSLINPALETLLTTINADASAALIERNDGQKIYTASQYELINPIFIHTTSDFTATPGQISLPDGSSPRALATLFGTRHNLDLTISGDGSGSINWPYNKLYPLTNNGTVGVPEGIAVTAEAKANTCSTVNWIGCDSVSGGETLTSVCTVNPFTVDKHVNAIFTPNTHNVTTSVANGTGDLSCTSQICYGDSSVCTITPGVGYSLTSLTDNGANRLGDVIGGASYLVQNIVAAHSVIAGFTPIPITVTPSASTNGSISPNTVQTVNYGSTTSFTLTPSTGYHIASVGGTCGGTLTGSTFTTTAVASDCTVVANFAVDTFAVTFASGNNGSLTGSASQTINYGASATAVTAVPATGYHFVNWSGTGGFVTSTTNPMTVTNVTAVQSITANFAVDTFAVTFASGGNGSLTGNANQTISYGASATAVTAVPTTGYHFVNWTGTGGFVTSTTNPLTVTNITASQSVTANFAINGYTVTPSAVANGSISPTASQTVNYGSVASFTLTPSTEYHIASIGGTCGGALSGSTFTTTAVTGDCTVVASFALNQYQVTPYTSLNGSISPSTPQAVQHGSSTTFSLLPDSGFSIVSAIGCNGNLSGSNYTTGTITGNCTVSATFIPNTFTVSFTSGGNGYLTGTANQTIGYGASAIAITAVPATGYHFVNWTGTGGFVTSTANPLTVTNVTASQSVTANYAINGYSVTPSVVANGSISPIANQTVNYGSVASFTLTPSTGYHIASIGGTCGGTLTGSTFTTTAVASDCTVAANFAVDTFAVTFASGNNGSLTGSASQTINYGASATAVTAVPATGYHFVNWSGTGGFVTSTTNPMTVTNVTAVQSITANFAVDTFAVTIASGGNGSLTGTANQTISYGASATAVTAVPATGYHFVNWTGTGGFVTSTTNPLTVTNVTASQSVTANFAINGYTVIPSVVANGSISPTASQTVNYGSAASFTLIPSTGYHIASIGGTCGGALSGSTFTTTAVTGDCTVVASFALNSYVISPSAGSNGSISPSIQQSVSHLSSASFTLTPDIGYSIKDVSGCGGTLAGNIYTSGIVTGDCSISAMFIAIPAVTASISGSHGTVICSPPVVSGEATSCTVTPEIGFHLASFTDNGVPVFDSMTNGYNYTLNSVTSSHAITASFIAYSLNDALHALRIAVGIEQEKPGERLWLDVAPLDSGKPSGNNKIDILDALVLLKHSIGAYTTW